MTLTMMDNKGHEAGAIADTDSDALLARIAAAEAGYFKDQFSPIFASRRAVGVDPIMNRGSWLRKKFIDEKVIHFLKKYRTTSAEDRAGPQIVSLGAGSDTRFFNLLQSHRDLLGNALYIEIDVPSTAARKIAIIESSRELMGLIHHKRPSEADPYDRNTALNDNFSLPTLDHGSEHKFLSENYAIVGQDIRTIASNGITGISLNYNAPTLFISECCLVYIDPSDSQELMDFTTQKFSSVAWLLYEPIQANDQFGMTMLKNLKESRDLQLPGLTEFSSSDDQRRRIQQLGLDKEVQVQTMKKYYDQLDQKIKMSTPLTDRLDEVEQWNLMASHYCFVYAEKSQL